MKKIMCWFMALTMMLIVSSMAYATSPGFRLPMKENYSVGYDYLDGPIDYGCSGGLVYHPGVDLNKAGTSCDDDRGTRIYAVGNGIVKDVGNGLEWGSILIEHNYQGTKYYSQYGHMDPPYLLSVGEKVYKGQHIGYMGDVEAECVHLHFEIREHDHPRATDAQAFCSILGGTPRATVDGWYEDPINFINSHQCSLGTANTSVRWHPDGTLVRAIGGINVYLIHNGDRKHITDGDFLDKYKYGFDWNNIIEVPQEEIDCFPVGNDINVYPRSVKASGPDVYLIFNGISKRKFNSPEVFEGLGYSWEDIESISDGELNSYTNDPVSPILYSPYSDGTLISKSNGTVYIISNGKKSWIENETVFNKLGYNWSCIVQETDSFVNSIPDGPSISEDKIIQCGADNAPLPDIKANGSDGPLTIYRGDNLTVTVALDPRSHDGEDADWWVAATSPFGLYWFTLDFGWLRSDAPIRVYGGSLFTLLPYEVLNTTGLPIGTYIFYFGVDLLMNRSLDFDRLCYDSVSVSVSSIFLIQPGPEGKGTTPFNRDGGG